MSSPEIGSKNGIIIGMLGAKGAGKDTVAERLVKYHGFIRVGFADELYRQVANTFGVTVDFLGNRTTKESPLPELALKNCADPEFVKIALEIAKKEKVPGLKGLFLRLYNSFSNSYLLNAPRSPRWTLQLWGSEYRRIAGGNDSYWLNIVKDVISKNPTANYVITDVRFKNEATFTTSFGGILVRVRRKKIDEAERLARESKRANGSLHISETEMIDYPVTATLDNVEGQPDSLLSQLKALLEKIS